MDESTEGQLSVIRKVTAVTQEFDIPVWLFGGWGLDARIGRITREHGDVEFWVERRRGARCLQARCARASAARPRRARARPDAARHPGTPGDQRAEPRSRTAARPVSWWGRRRSLRLAADPADPRHLVAAWQQDRARTGGSLGAAVAVSRDGGVTWSEQMLPGIARCAGGSSPLVTDVWVTIGPDHTAYASLLTLATLSSLPSGLSVVVSASRDGGATWGAPTVGQSWTGLRRSRPSPSRRRWTPAG